MGIESGPSGAVAVVPSGPSLGRGSLSLTREFGPVMTAADIGPIGIGGVAEGGLKNTMSQYTSNNISPNKSIIEPVHQADQIDPLAEIAEASQPSTLILTIESFLSKARLNKVDQSKPVLREEEAVVEPEELPQPILNPDLPKLEAVRQRISLFFEEKQSHGLLEANQNTTIPEIVIVPQTQPDNIIPFIPAPALESASKVGTTLAVQSPQIIQSSLAPAVEEQIEELVEKEVVTDRPEETLENMEEERVADFKLSHAVDPKALEIRTRAVIEGVIKVGITEGVSAKTETEEISQAINGQEIVDNIVAKQSIKYRGQELNKIDPRGNLPDGGWEVNQRKIANTKFYSIADAVQRVPEILAEDPPVLEGEGEPVTNKNVATSLKYAPGEIHPAQIVIKRVVRMEKQVKIVKRSRQQPVQIISIEEKIIEKNEGIPPDLAAALLVPVGFQKAA